MSSRGILSCVLRAFLAALVFVQAPLAARAEASFWRDRRSRSARAAASLASLPAPILPIESFTPSSLESLPRPLAAQPSLPWAEAVSPYAWVRSVRESLRPGAPRVVLIQDAHDVQDAQKNIAAVIAEIAKGARPGGETLVALEGAWGPFRTEEFRAGPRPDLTPFVAGYLMKEGFIGGAEWAALTLTPTPRLWGAEDPALYRDHIAAFQEASALKPAAQAALARLKASVEERKQRVFSPALLAVDRLMVGDAVGPLLRGLWDGLEGDTSVRRRFPQTALFIGLLEEEASLDFASAERDRSALARDLAERLSPASLSAVAARAADLKAGRLSASDFYAGLLSESSRAGVVPGPHLSRYVRHLRRSEGLNRDRLMGEKGRLEREVPALLARTPEARALVDESRRLRLTEKLLNHALSPEEWAAYRAERGAIHDLLAADAALLAPFKRYCDLAERRNESLAEGFLKEAVASGAGRDGSPAVLVAGGFHTEGLADIFFRRGWSSAVVTPRFDPAGAEGKNGLDVFIRDPLPLEKLLSGDGVGLLHDRVLARETRPEAADTVRVLETLANSLPLAVDAAEDGVVTSLDLKNHQAGAAGFGLVVDLVSASTGWAKLKIQAFGRRLTLSLSMKKGAPAPVPSSRTVASGRLDTDPQSSFIVERESSLRGESFLQFFKKFSDLFSWGRAAALKSRPVAAHDQVIAQLAEIRRFVPELRGRRGDALFHRLTHPEKEYHGSFSLVLDNGLTETVEYGRYQHNRAAGPHKGGVRASDTVSREDEIALSLWMTFKNALIGNPYGGGKGGLRFTRKYHLYSDAEKARAFRGFVRAILSENPDALGPEQDIPAPDMNTGPKEMAWMMEEFLLFRLAEGRFKDHRLLGALRVKFGILPSDGFNAVQEKLEAAHQDLDPALNPVYSTYLEIWNANPDFIPHELGFVTGKPVGVAGKRAGGSEGRTEATGYGVAFIAEKAVPALLGRPLAGATFAVQGFGNVGSYTALKLHALAGKVIAVGDFDGGGVVHNPEGLDIPTLFRHFEEKRAAWEGLKNAGVDPGPRRFFEGFKGFQPAGTSDILTDFSPDVLVPAAIGGVITEKNAENIKAHLIIEAANGPVTPAADAILKKRKIPSVPDILANAGGVRVSYYEWDQNLKNERWDREDVHARLKSSMDGAFDAVFSTYQELNKKHRGGVSLRQAAYVVSLKKVIRDMMAARGTSSLMMSEGTIDLLGEWVERPGGIRFWLATRHPIPAGALIETLGLVNVLHSRIPLQGAALLFSLAMHAPGPVSGIFWMGLSAWTFAALVGQGHYAARAHTNETREDLNGRLFQTQMFFFLALFPFVALDIWAPSLSGDWRFQVLSLTTGLFLEFVYHAALNLYRYSRGDHRLMMTGGDEEVSPSWFRAALRKLDVDDLSKVKSFLGRLSEPQQKAFRDVMARMAPLWEALSDDQKSSFLGIMGVNLFSVEDMRNKNRSAKVAGFSPQDVLDLLKAQVKTYSSLGLEKSSPSPRAHMEEPTADDIVTLQSEIPDVIEELEMEWGFEPAAAPDLRAESPSSSVPEEAPVADTPLPASVAPIVRPPWLVEDGHIQASFSALLRKELAVDNSRFPDFRALGLAWRSMPSENPAATRLLAEAVAGWLYDHRRPHRSRQDRGRLLRMFLEGVRQADGGVADYLRFKRVLVKTPPPISVLRPIPETALPSLPQAPPVPAVPPVPSVPVPSVQETIPAPPVSPAILSRASAPAESPVVSHRSPLFFILLAGGLFLAAYAGTKGFWHALKTSSDRFVEVPPTEKAPLAIPVSVKDTSLPVPDPLPRATSRPSRPYDAGVGNFVRGDLSDLARKMGKASDPFRESMDTLSSFIEDSLSGWTLSPGAGVLSFRFDLKKGPRTGIALSFDESFWRSFLMEESARPSPVRRELLRAHLIRKAAVLRFYRSHPEVFIELGAAWEILSGGELPTASQGLALRKAVVAHTLYVLAEVEMRTWRDYLKARGVTPEAIRAEIESSPRNLEGLMAPSAASLWVLGEEGGLTAAHYHRLMQEPRSFGTLGRLAESLPREAAGTRFLTDPAFTMLRLKPLSMTTEGAKALLNSWAAGPNPVKRWLALGVPNAVVAAAEGLGLIPVRNPLPVPAWAAGFLSGRVPAALLASFSVFAGPILFGLSPVLVLSLFLPLFLTIALFQAHYALLAHHNETGEQRAWRTTFTVLFNVLAVLPAFFLATTPVGLVAGAAAGLALEMTFHGILNKTLTAFGRSDLSMTTEGSSFFPAGWSGHSLRSTGRLEEDLLEHAGSLKLMPALLRKIQARLSLPNPEESFLKDRIKMTRGDWAGKNLYRTRAQDLRLLFRFDPVLKTVSLARLQKKGQIIGKTGDNSGSTNPRFIKETASLLDDPKAYLSSDQSASLLADFGVSAETSTPLPLQDVYFAPFGGRAEAAMWMDRVLFSALQDLDSLRAVEEWLKSQEKVSYGETPFTLSALHEAFLSAAEDPAFTESLADWRQMWRDISRSWERMLDLEYRKDAPDFERMGRVWGWLTPVTPGIEDLWPKSFARWAANPRWSRADVGAAKQAFRRGVLSVQGAGEDYDAFIGAVAQEARAGLWKHARHSEPAVLVQHEDNPEETMPSTPSPKVSVRGPSRQEMKEAAEREKSRLRDERRTLREKEKALALEEVRRRAVRRRRIAISLMTVPFLAVAALVWARWHVDSSAEKVKILPIPKESTPGAPPVVSSPASRRAPDLSIRPVLMSELESFVRDATPLTAPKAGYLLETLRRKPLKFTPNGKPSVFGNIDVWNNVLDTVQFRGDSRLWKWLLEGIYSASREEQDLCRALIRAEFSGMAAALDEMRQNTGAVVSLWMAKEAYTRAMFGTEKPERRAAVLKENPDILDFGRMILANALHLEAVASAERAASLDGVRVSPEVLKQVSAQIPDPALRGYFAARSEELGRWKSSSLEGLKALFLDTLLSGRAFSEEYVGRDGRRLLGPVQAAQDLRALKTPMDFLTAPAYFNATIAPWKTLGPRIQREIRNASAQMRDPSLTRAARALSDSLGKPRMNFSLVGEPFVFARFPPNGEMPEISLDPLLWSSLLGRRDASKGLDEALLAHVVRAGILRMIQVRSLADETKVLVEKTSRNYAAAMSDFKTPAQRALALREDPALLDLARLLTALRIIALVEDEMLRKRLTTSNGYIPSSYLDTLASRGGPAASFFRAESARLRPVWTSVQWRQSVFNMLLYSPHVFPDGVGADGKPLAGAHQAAKDILYWDNLRLGRPLTTKSFSSDLGGFLTDRKLFPRTKGFSFVGRSLRSAYLRSPLGTALFRAPVQENVWLMLPAYTLFFIASFFTGMPLALLPAAAWIFVHSLWQGFWNHSTVFVPGRVDADDLPLSRPSTFLERLSISLVFASMGVLSGFLTLFLMQTGPGLAGIDPLQGSYALEALKGWGAGAVLHAVLNWWFYNEGQILLTGARPPHHGDEDINSRRERIHELEKELEKFGDNHTVIERVRQNIEEIQKQILQIKREMRERVLSKAESRVLPSGATPDRIPESLGDRRRRLRRLWSMLSPSGDPGEFLAVTRAWRRIEPGTPLSLILSPAELPVDTIFYSALNKKFSWRADLISWMEKVEKLGYRPFLVLEEYFLEGKGKTYIIRDGGPTKEDMDDWNVRFKGRAGPSSGGWGSVMRVVLFFVLIFSPGVHAVTGGNVAVKAGLAVWAASAAVLGAWFSRWFSSRAVPAPFLEEIQDDALWIERVLPPVHPVAIRIEEGLLREDLKSGTLEREAFRRALLRDVSVPDYNGVAGEEESVDFVLKRDRLSSGVARRRLYALSGSTGSGAVPADFAHLLERLSFVRVVDALSGNILAVGRAEEELRTLLRWRASVLGQSSVEELNALLDAHYNAPLREAAFRWDFWRTRVLKGAFDKKMPVIVDVTKWLTGDARDRERLDQALGDLEQQLKEAGRKAPPVALVSWKPVDDDQLFPLLTKYRGTRLAKAPRFIQGRDKAFFTAEGKVDAAAISRDLNGRARERGAGGLGVLTFDRDMFAGGEADSIWFWIPLIRGFVYRLNEALPAKFRNRRFAEMST